LPASDETDTSDDADTSDDDASGGWYAAAIAALTVSGERLAAQPGFRQQTLTMIGAAS
jgi:hypothetical protein